MNRHDDYLRSDVPGMKLDKISTVRYSIHAASVVLADADGILDGEDFPASAGFVSDFEAQPPYPMTITAVASGTQTGKVLLVGEDIAGNVIEEELTMTSDTPVESAKAFAKITAIKLPIKVGSETIDVGWGNKFALPYKLVFAPQVIVKLFNGAADAGTVTANATDLAKNVYDPNGTPDGAKALDFYILL